MSVLSLFPSVQGDIDKVAPSQYEEIHQLSREIMILPCDQRYGPEDMYRTIKAFKKSRAAIWMKSVCMAFFSSKAGYCDGFTRLC